MKNFEESALTSLEITTILGGRPVATGSHRLCEFDADNVDVYIDQPYMQ